jgi:aromatic-L-amino-acid decarboxylase
MDNQESCEKRVSPLAMGSEEFRALGSQLVDRIANFLDSLPERRVTPGESPSEIRQALGAERALPQKGTEPGGLLHK